MVSYIIIIIIIIIKFLTSQFCLGNIHLFCDVEINRIRLGDLIYSFKSSLQSKMCQELHIFAFVYLYSGASQVVLDFVIVTLELLP